MKMKFIFSLKDFNAKRVRNASKGFSISKIMKRCTLEIDLGHVLSKVGRILYEIRLPYEFFDQAPFNPAHLSSP